jgi:starch synthase
VFTIHNLAYQGNFDRDDWSATGLPDSLYTPDALEFYGGWSFMKGGLTFSDRVNTVSETYAKEIQTLEYGCGLDGLMRTLWQTGRLSGILNGIDYEVNDPETDPYIPAHFSPANVAGKVQCKAALQQELSLDVDPATPLIGLVSRLADQKGLDLIHAAIEDILALPVQFALLGTGDRSYEAFFRCLQERFPGRVHARIAFDIGLAQRIYAGSDLFLMPSRFEPCGLNQMYSQAYGSPPVVAATGGLVDSVIDASADPVQGTGFIMTTPDLAGLQDACQRAMDAWRARDVWKRIQLNGMARPFAWEQSAERYLDVYRKAIETSRAGVPQPA